MRISNNLKKKWIAEGFMRARSRFASRNSGIYEIVDAIRPGLYKVLDGLEGDDRAVAKQAVCWLAKKLRIFGFSFDRMTGTIMTMLCSVVSEKMSEVRGGTVNDYFDIVGDCIAEYDEDAEMAPKKTSAGSSEDGPLMSIWRNRDKYN